MKFLVFEISDFTCILHIFVKFKHVPYRFYKGSPASSDSVTLGTQFTERMLASVSPSSSGLNGANFIPTSIIDI
jgi:hypothetical protein